MPRDSQGPSRQDINPSEARLGVTSETPEKLLPARLGSVPDNATALLTPRGWGGGGCDTWPEALLRCPYLYLSLEPFDLSLYIYRSWQRKKICDITLADLPWVLESRLHQVPNM